MKFNVLVLMLTVRGGSDQKMLQHPPLLLALFCLPSCLPPAPAPYQPLPTRAQRIMFITRRAAEYVSQKVGAQHQNKNHFNLI